MPKAQARAAKSPLGGRLGEAGPARTRPGKHLSLHDLPSFITHTHTPGDLSRSMFPFLVRAFPLVKFGSPATGYAVHLATGRFEIMFCVELKCDP